MSWLQVRVGEWNLNKIDGTERDFEVEKILVHPKWNPHEPDWYKTFGNDIALVKLTQRVDLRGEY